MASKTAPSRKRLPTAPVSDSAFSVALAHHQEGRFAEAAEGYKSVLARQPQHADCWHLMGVLALQAGKPAEALDLIGRALLLQPNQADYFINLATAQQHLGLPTAKQSLETALKLNPRLAMAHNNLALLLQASGEIGAAIRHFQDAEKLGFHAAKSNLGSLFAEQGRIEEAVACHEAAVAADPASVDARYNLANSYVRAGRSLDAVQAYQQVLERLPSHADSWNNIGIELGKLGRIADATDALRVAMELSPQNAGYHSNLIFFLDYDVRGDAALQQAERKRWWQEHIAPLGLTQPTYVNERSPSRKLRIGYVSADFWQHSAAFTFAPMLLEYDRDHFEVFIYANQKREDSTTQQLREAVTGWRSIVAVDDATVAEQIRADGIDILVDLSAHSAGNRLGVFAYRPAPIQMSAWGHANGTGMPEIDYLFSDAVTLPPELAPLYAEELIYLPCTLTYSPGLRLPDIDPSPVTSTGHLTFGCFNRLGKVDAVVLAVWAEILVRIPTAHLLFKSPELSETEARGELLQRLGAAGIDIERIILLGKTSQAEHLAAYNQVDICLDPFPHGGGISTFEALCMGVPVITLLGNTQVGRLTAGIVSAVGLSDWVASDRAMYVQLAQQKVTDVAALTDLRGRLREQVAASPAGNPVLYVAHVETAYRALWQKWVTQPS